MNFSNLTLPSDPVNATGTLLYAPLEFVDKLPALAIVLIVVLIVAAAVGTAGNLLILASVATYKDLQNVESVFVVNLACSDLYVTLIADPLSIVGKTAGWEFFDKVPGLCRAVGSLCTISCVGSLMTLSAMSCNRYVLIVHPNHYRRVFTLRNCIVMCCSFYLVGFTLVSLNFFGVGDHSFDHKSLECIWDRMANHNYTIVFSIVLVWIPIIVTGLSYSRLYLHVRHVRMKVHNHGNNSIHVPSTSHVSEGDNSVNVRSQRSVKETPKNDIELVAVQNFGEEKISSVVPHVVNVDTLSTTVESKTDARKLNTVYTLKPPAITDESGSDYSKRNLLTVQTEKLSVNGKGNAQSQDRPVAKISPRSHTFRLARTLFFIYLVFSICWLPFSLLMILDNEDTFAHELHVVIVAWAHLHPSINWLVYYHTHSKFRRTFRKLLRLDKCFRRG